MGTMCERECKIAVRSVYRYLVEVYFGMCRYSMLYF